MNKYNYTEKKDLEGILHPIPKINGADILHIHKKNGMITFSAWCGQKQLNEKEYNVHKLLVLRLANDFYKDKKINENLTWLTNQNSNIRSK